MKRSFKGLFEFLWTQTVSHLLLYCYERDFRSYLHKCNFDITPCVFSFKLAIKYAHKTLNFRKHFDTISTEEIRTANFCHEVFAMSKHLMTKIYIPDASSYMSPFRAIVQSFQFGIIVIW